MSSSLTVSEARAALPAVLDRVEAGEEISITRHGRVVAVVVAPEALRTRRAATTLAAASQLHDLLELGKHTVLDATAALTREQADALGGEVARGRRARSQG
jgi:prevent-host-death family protein